MKEKTQSPMQKRARATSAWDPGHRAVSVAALCLTHLPSPRGDRRSLGCLATACTEMGATRSASVCWLVSPSPERKEPTKAQETSRVASRRELIRKSAAANRALREKTSLCRE